MPVIVKIRQFNGDNEVVKLLVEIGQRGGTWTFKFASNNKIDKVIIDPENILPEVDRKNNEWNK